MSIQEVQRLSEDLKSNAALQDAFRQAGTDPEAITRLAQEHGYDIAAADLQAAANQAKAEMTDDQLDKVAGGYGDTVAVVVGPMVVVVAYPTQPSPTAVLTVVSVAATV